MRTISAFWLLPIMLGCSGEAAPVPGGLSLAQSVTAASVSADALRGGRLYDRFYRENPGVQFAPDSADTPGVGDGLGGPFGDGTLRDAFGLLVHNDLNHGYRLKNFFGWDLRGASGVYGPGFQNQAFVQPYNLILDPMTRQDVATLLVDGAPGIPAFEDVMPMQDLADVVEFVMAVRDHRLPQPGDIWQLNAAAPNGYSLNPGASVENGRGYIATSCGSLNCHGADGTRLLFDEGEFTLGTLARANAYEVWFKIVAGDPGSIMGGQVPVAEAWQVQSRVVLDVLAALCDRTSFPQGVATGADVVDGDLRCGQYLR